MKDPRKDLPPVNAPQFLEKVREAIQTYLGNRGDALDRGVTLRDITSGNLPAIRPGSGSGGSITNPGPNPGGGGAYEPDLTPPPTPTGFNAQSAIMHVLISHDDPNFLMGNGYLRTNVYGLTWTPGQPLPTFANALPVTQFTGTIFGMASNPATTWHLWIKWETNDNVESVAPAGGINGVVVRTGEDVALLLEALNGQITASQLYADLGTRIDLIDGDANGSVNARLAAERAARIAALTVEATDRANSIQNEAGIRADALLAEALARADADSALQTQVNLLTASSSGDLGEYIAAVQTEQTARIAADAAEATSRETLATQMRGAYTGTNIAQVATGLIHSERTARTSADAAITSSVSTLSSTVTNNFNTLNSAITTEATTRATADQTEATSRNTLTTKLIGAANPATATLATLSSGLLYDERTSRSTADATEVTARQLLSSTMLGTTNPAGKTLDNVTSGLIFDERTLRTTADTALATRASVLEAKVNNATTGLAAKASISYVDTAKADAIAASVSQINTLQSQIEARPNLCADVDSWSLSTGFYLITDGWGRSARIDAHPTATSVCLSPKMPCYPNLTYTVSGDSMCLGVGRVYFDIEFYSATGAIVGDGLQKIISVPHDHGNNRLEHAVATVAPPTATKMAARFVCYGASGNHPVGFRRVKVEDGPLPATIYTQEGEIGGINASVSQEASTRATQTDELYAQYTVKVDVNGYVAGYGLASTAKNGAPQSAFAVRADKFYVASPAGPGVAPVTPFSVVTVPTVINGVNVPVGVYMDAAFIKHGTFSGAKIARLTVDDGAIVNLGVGKLTTGSISVGTYIQSPNYVPNVRGWRIHGNGSAEFSGVIVRGTVYANAGEFRGIDIKDASGNVILSSGASLKNQIAGNLPEKFKNNLIDCSTWIVSTHDGVSGFNRNGGVYVQYRHNAWLPDGSQGMAWHCYPGLYYNKAYGWDNPLPGGVPAGQADGGWNTDLFNIDPYRAYRFSVWVQRTSGSTGNVYLGCQPDTVCSMPSRTADTNPYFLTQPISSLDMGRWYLMVGYIYPTNESGQSQRGQSGLYDGTTGAKVVNGSDFTWVATAKHCIHRAYLFYSAPSSEINFAWPRVDLANGAEPSLSQLLAGGSVSARNKISSSNASTFIDDLAVNTLQIAGNAVTIPMGSYVAGDFFYTGESNRVTMPSTGQPTMVSFTCMCYGYVEYIGGNSFVNINVEVLRNNTTLYYANILSITATGESYDKGHVHGKEVVAFNVMDTPPAGTASYVVNFYITATGPKAQGQAAKRGLTVLGCKK